jgi:hypothetical protein
MPRRSAPKRATGDGDDVVGDGHGEDEDLSGFDPPLHHPRFVTEPADEHPTEITVGKPMA